MIHERAVVHPAARLAPDCQVWSGAVVEADVRCGPRCTIGSNAFVGAGTSLGEGCRIQHGAFITRRTKIGNFVFIGPNVTFTDDRRPRVANPGTYKAEPPVVEDGASIGAGAILLPGVRIGLGAMVGAGAVVAHDVASGDTVIGVPARSQGVGHA